MATRSGSPCFQMCRFAAGWWTVAMASQSFEVLWTNCGRSGVHHDCAITSVPSVCPAECRVRSGDRVAAVHASPIRAIWWSDAERGIWPRDGVCGDGRDSMAGSLLQEIAAAESSARYSRRFRQHLSQVSERCKRLRSRSLFEVEPAVLKSDAHVQPPAPGRRVH